VLVGGFDKHLFLVEGDHWQLGEPELIHNFIGGFLDGYPRCLQRGCEGGRYPHRLVLKPSRIPT
jgi:hypothetical protein